LRDSGIQGLRDSGIEEFRDSGIEEFKDKVLYNRIYPIIPKFTNLALININSVQKIDSFLELMTRSELTPD
jgi:hypothetical protein